MNTPAHLIVGLAAFGRPGRPWTAAAALAGSLLPDLSLYLMVGWHLAVLGTEARVVFGQLYYSDAWQQVFAIDNSALLWGGLLAVSLWRRWQVVTAFAGAGMLHLALDFPLHAGDGRAHFWPLSDWILDSPLSYWDRSHHGALVGAAEVLVCLVLVAVLWRRLRDGRWRAGLIVLALAELASGNVWALLF